MKIYPQGIFAEIFMEKRDFELHLKLDEDE